MSWLRVSALVLAVVISGCKDERLLAREKEIAEAEKQLAELNALHKRLLAEKQSLEQKAREAEAGAQSTRAEHQQALAAAAWLSPELGESLPLDDDMRQARLHFELTQALAQKDTARLNTLITAATRPEWECLAPGEEEVTCGMCTPPEDSCKDVPEQLQLDPRWSCQAVPRDGAPPDVFCTGSVDYLPSSERSDDANMQVDLIRVAFAHEDEIYVSDLDPSDEAFVSANPYARDNCYRNNQGMSCEYHCRLAQYTGPCACHGEHYEEDPEELDRMCDCMTDHPLYMGAPSIQESSTLERSPTPGVFVVRVAIELDDRSGSITRKWLLRVLVDRARTELAESGIPPTNYPRLRKLEQLAEFEEWGEGGPDSGDPARVAWIKLPESTLEAVLGFQSKELMSFACHLAPLEGAEAAKVITRLTPDMFCPFITREPSRFPPDFLAWCGKNWRSAPPGVPAANSDAGGTR